MNTIIQFRRGTASEWSAVNPALAAGEVGYETDTGKIKVGNGSTTWNGLPYSSEGPTGPTGLTGATGPTGPTGVAGALNDLSDVDTTGVATGSIILYNGTSWVVSDLNSQILADSFFSGS